MLSTALGVLALAAVLQPAGQQPTGPQTASSGAVSVLVAGTPPAGVPGDAVASLVVLVDHAIGGVVARQAAEAGGGVVVGGLEADSQRPLILVLDAAGATGGPLRALTAPASPFFAVSPDGASLAYWRSVATAGGAAMGQVVTYDLASGSSAAMSPPMLMGGTDRIVWPYPGNVVFAAPRPLPGGRTGVLWRLDVGTGRTVCLLTRGAGAPAGSVYPGVKADTVIYTDPAGCLAVPVTGAAATPADLDSYLYRRPGAKSWLSLGASVALKGGEGSPSLGLAATGAAWAPDGSACLLATATGLYAAPADLSFARKLEGWEGSPTDFTCPLWRTGLADAAVGSGGASPAFHLFTLGTQAVEATLLFPSTAAPAAGARVWVARRFLRTAAGAVVKPEWDTLKACLRVASATAGPDGVRVRAVNDGTQSGVVERLALPGAAPSNLSELATTRAGRRIVWLRQWDTACRADLQGWVDGVPVLGRLVGLSIERKRLGAP